MREEAGRGEAWSGQHEITFRFADALTMADNHVVYKNGAKEIANANGCSITFMAKPFESWIGNSCHIHASPSLREAILALEIGTARGAFGDHYLNYAHTEQALFDKVVTNWERTRLFERG